ncbi:FtsX-like permease family protein [Streptomyces sp. QHH-9511]|uniref:FtsX-like permease family protein n=1 Tax=Streptomyces sp. QHH-9511 TaxID=2684468 RepID=UPI001316EB01|nr:ABC transporter permease [Streptomyces sp. QHH-9511]QGZ48973.1 FtsX-like permease family protein [Streptomyces sp. QHH-9511]
MTGFVLLRVRAHRLLLAAALLAVLLTTSVLAALAAFSGSIGDAALQGTLRGRAAPAAALVMAAQVPVERRERADTAAREGARKAFDGLPVSVRRLELSGPYALPRGLQDPAARLGEPDLTHVAALDRSRLTLVEGAWPTASGTGASAAARTVEAAVPEEAAKRLRVRPGTVLDLTDRIGGKPVKARITGVYRPADLTDPYWQLDPAGGRGVKTVVFTTYGPLLAHPAVLGSGQITPGETSWLATADFTGVTTDRMDALRASATRVPQTLAADTAAFGSTASVRTALPTVLEQTERALLVSRSTLMIVAVQLVLLAAYALLLVARLLSSERSGETALLRARGGSRRRIASLAAVEALLLALPAAVIAPLLAGPLTRLLADRSSLRSLGVRLDDIPLGQVWLVAGIVAVCCAAAVVAPALSTGDGGAVTLRKGRTAALPAPVRAGADVGLLVLAAVAYWQLDRQTGVSGSGALSGDREGGLGIDPLLVAAPALALLAGTVLTLRLLPPAARLAERRAAGGRGLPAALAGWQFSRRPLRGAGPVLLLVLAVAMGMLAVGQSASWSRSQEDQADFRTGTAVRVLTSGSADPAQAGRYSSLPGVRSASPAHRATMDVAGNRTATVLALDTRLAADGFLLRADLADRPGPSLLTSSAPAAGPRPGIPLPSGTAGVALDLRRTAPAGTAPAQVTVVLEDQYGIPYRQLLGPLPPDGKPHRLSLRLQGGVSVGPLTLTGVELDGRVRDGEGGQQTFSVDRLVSLLQDGTERPVDTARAFASWKTGYQETAHGERRDAVPLAARSTPTTPYTVGFSAGAVSAETAASPFTGREDYGLRVTAPRPAPPATLRGVATDAFLAAARARKGDRVEASLGGMRVTVTIVDTARELPTTGPGARAVSAAAPTATPDDGGALLVDLRAVNQFLLSHPSHTGATLPPTEWWLTTAPGRADEVARTLRARPDADPAQVLVRDEAAAELLGDPLGAGPDSALMAVAAAAAALAAVGFAVSAAGSTRERSAEFGVLRALGAPRRQLARLIAAEQGLLVGIGLVVGAALGAVLTRAVVPLVVLTGQAARPVPRVLVELPPGHVALLLAGVAALPLLIVAGIALRRTDPAVTLRHQGDH